MINTCIYFTDVGFFFSFSLLSSSLRKNHICKLYLPDSYHRCNGYCPQFNYVCKSLNATVLYQPLNTTCLGRHASDSTVGLLD